MEAVPLHLDPEAELYPLAQGRSRQPLDLRALTSFGDYGLDFTPGGQSLVITFESREDKRTDPGRLPWSYNLVRAQGHAVLGIKPEKPDWYQGEALHRFFTSEDFQSILGAYDQVLFYGSAMGGFGALTFATPGSLVLAHNPQTSLDPRLVPWDKRYPEAAELGWDGPFADAAAGAARAARVFVTYDPFFDIGRRHVDRLDPANLVRLKAPFLGHILPGYLWKMRLLAPLVPMALADELTSETWHAMIRKRRELPRYFLTMSEFVKTPEAQATLLARAWQASAGEERAQEQIRRQAERRKLGDLFEQMLAGLRPLSRRPARDAPGTRPMVTGPSGPDEELFSLFLAQRG